MLNENVKQVPACLAPWVHSFINTRGKRNLCCFKDYSDKEVGPDDHQSFDSYWNSDEMKGLRLQMLSGSVPRDCFPCSDKIFHNQQPRFFFFDKYTHLIPEILQSTSENGSTQFLPKFYDYRFSNHCQLACRMCDGRSSSRIEKIESEYSNTPNVENLVRPFIQSEILPDLLQAVESGRVDQLYWAGGEPLLTPEHWQVMKAAVSSGQSKMIDVLYNTNLGLLNSKYGNLLELLPSFKRITVLASLDAVDELGEYIREGLNFKQFCENLNLLNKVPNTKVLLTITITLPGLLEIEKLAAFICQHQLEYDVHFASANGMHELLTPLILPRQLRDDVVNKALKRLELFTDPRVQGLRDNLALILTHPTLEEKFPDQFEEEFFLHREKYLKRDQNENKSLANIYKSHDLRLWKWWVRPSVPKISTEENWLRELHQFWFKAHLDLLPLGRAAYLFSQDSALLRQFRDYANESSDRQIDFIHLNDCEKIPADCYDLFILSNEWPDMLILEQLRGKLKDSGCLSLIAPHDNLLNRWIHRKQNEVYRKKLVVSQELHSEKLRAFPALSYMARQRRWPDIIIGFLKVVEKIPFFGSLSLHAHFVLLKRKS